MGLVPKLRDNLKTLSHLNFRSTIDLLSASEDNSSYHNDDLSPSPIERWLKPLQEHLIPQHFPATLQVIVNTGTPEVKIAKVRLQNSCKSVLDRGYKLTSIYSNSNTSDCIGPS